MSLIFTLYGLTISALMGCLIKTEYKYMRRHSVSIAVIRATIDGYQSMPAGRYIEDPAARQVYRSLSTQVRGPANTSPSSLRRMIPSLR